MKRANLAILLIVLAATLALGVWRQASFDPARDGLETAFLQHGCPARPGCDIRIDVYAVE